MQLSVGASIRKRRKARDWTQVELAKNAGVSPETVVRAEQGSNVEVDSLLKITRALGVELEMALREPGGLVEAIRDVSLPVTPPVSASGQTRDAPGEEGSSVLPPSFPMSPAHVVLYAFIAKLTIEQADQLTRPLLDLIDRITQPTEPPKPTKKPTK